MNRDLIILFLCYQARGMKATEMIFFLIKKTHLVCILTPKMKNERGRAKAVNQPNIFLQRDFLSSKKDLTFLELISIKVSKKENFFHFSNKQELKSCHLNKNGEDDLKRA